MFRAVGRGEPRAALQIRRHGAVPPCGGTAEFVPARTVPAPENGSDCAPRNDQNRPALSRPAPLVDGPPVPSVPAPVLAADREYCSDRMPDFHESNVQAFLRTRSATRSVGSPTSAILVYVRQRANGDPIPFPSFDGCEQHLVGYHDTLCTMAGFILLLKFGAESGPMARWRKFFI